MENQNGTTNQKQANTNHLQSNPKKDGSLSEKYDWQSGREYLNLSQSEIHDHLEAMRRVQRISGFESQKVPYDEKLMAYFNSIYEEKEEKKIEYGDARIEFYFIWKEIIFGDRDSKQKPFIDPQDAWIVREFVKWIIRDESCDWDLDRGILMTGTQGCGKTTLMRTGLIFANRYMKTPFRIKRVNDIMFEVEKEKSITVIEPYFKENWCFDDIGQMNEDVVAYSKYNVVEMLINKRINSKYLTLATTNLKPEQLRERYGKVVASRMNEMFTAVSFGSEVDCRALK